MTYEISGKKQAGEYEDQGAPSAALESRVLVEEGVADGLTERDVLLGLVMEALSGGPVDVVASVTALGFGDIVETAKALIEIESEADADGDPAMEDPEAAPLDDSATAAEVLADNADAAGADDTSDGGDAA